MQPGTCTCNSVFAWGGGGGGAGERGYSQQNDAIITSIKRRTVFLSTVFPIDDYREPVHEISNNVVCATSKASEQPAHTRSLTRAFTSRLSIL